MEKEKKETVHCDGCQKEMPRTEAKFVSIKACCRVTRYPVCEECYPRYEQSKKL